MIELNDILTEDEIEYLKIERLRDFLSTLSLNDLFSKYSFDQGSMLIDEEKELLETITTNIHNRINNFGKLKLSITLTSHNPYYFTFFDSETNIHYRIDDFDELIEDAIYYKIEPYFKDVVNEISQNYK